MRLAVCFYSAYLPPNVFPPRRNLRGLQLSQLNVLQRLKSFICFKEKKGLVQSFILSNFEYCPLVWYFSSSKSLQNIEKLHERALTFLYNDHTSSYNDLLSKSDRCTMLISRQRALCIKIFKTVNKLNPPFMQKI